MPASTVSWSNEADERERYGDQHQLFIGNGSRNPSEEQLEFERKDDPTRNATPSASISRVFILTASGETVTESGREESPASSGCDSSAAAADRVRRRFSDDKGADSSRCFWNVGVHTAFSNPVNGVHLFRHGNGRPRRSTRTLLCVHSQRSIMAPLRNVDGYHLERVE